MKRKKFSQIEKYSMMNKEKILFILLFIILLFNPVSGNPPDSGRIEDTNIQSYEFHDRYIDSGIHASFGINQTWIGKIEGFTFLHSLSSDSFNYPRIDVVNRPTYTCGFLGLFTCYSNTSSQSIDFYDSATNQRLGSGELSYSIDMSNHLILSLRVDVWNAAGLTGGRKVNFTYTDFNPWFVRYNSYGYYNNLNGIYMQNATDVFFTNTACDPTTGCTVQSSETRIVSIDSSIHVDYERIYGATYDTWNFYRFVENYGETYSNITLEYSVNNSYQTVFSDSSYDDILNKKVPNGRNVRLTVNNPTTKQFYIYYWFFETEGLFDILLSKGLDEDIPLQVNEVAQAQAVFSGDYSQLGKIRWAYTQGSSVQNVGITVKTKEYTLNQTNGTWEYNNQGVYDLYNDVLRQEVYFMYDDLDSNWTKAQNNGITLYAWDKNNADFTPVRKKVYVGNTFQPYIRYWIYAVKNGIQQLVKNSALWIYDVTDNKYLSSGEIISTGSKLNTTTLNHSYVVWAQLTNHTQSEYCFNNPSETCYKITGKTANITPLYYGVSTLNIFLSPMAGTGNATITFWVKNAEGLPIEGALVHPAIGLSGFTDRFGIVSFTGLINGTIDDYYVSKEGWQTVGERYEIYDGLSIPVVLYPLEEIPTATLPTTPIPTGEEQPEDLFGLLLSLFEPYGISAYLFKLILGALVILSCAILMSKYSQAESAPLIGGVAGLIICFGAGLFPFWLAIIAIILFGLVYGSKIIKPNGG